jgi:hypothetical protein
MKRSTRRRTRSVMLLLLGSLLLSGRLDRTSLRLAFPSASPCMWMGRNRRPQGAVVETGTRSYRSGTISAYTVISHRGEKLVRDSHAHEESL